MQRSSRLGFLAGALLAAGGTAWFAKLAVIAVTNGRVTDTGPAAAFYLVGLVLLVVGAALCGVALTQGRPVIARVAAGALAPVGFAVLGITLLESSGRALLASEGTWWYDEVGVFLSAILGSVVGVVMLLRSRSHATPAPAA